jgi:flagellar protein FlgJ
MAAKGAMGIADLLIQQFGARVAATPAPTKPDGA